MNAKQFVKKLNKIPTQERIELLKELELSQDCIDEYVSSYQLEKNEIVTEINDPIINLLANYNGQKVKIGMITFDIELFETSNYYIFGRFEMDLLVLDKKSREIKMLDYEAIDYVICHCAKNSSLFLDSILIAAEFMEKLPYDDDLANSQLELCKMANLCAEKAGGNSYNNFYKMLIGCDS
jgi:hypothetical protein